MHRCPAINRRLAAPVSRLAAAPVPDGTSTESRWDPTPEHLPPGGVPQGWHDVLHRPWMFGYSRQS